MYYEDLTLCRYHTGPFDASNWQVPLLAVGWLERPHKFTSGTVSEAFLSKLRTFMPLAKASYSTFRGRHACSICKIQSTEAERALIGSEVVIFVPGNNTVYAASGGIVHYIEMHAYLPPLEFMEAVMQCPTYGSQEFQHALRMSNKGNPSPLLTRKEEVDYWQRQFAETLRQRHASGKNATGI